MSRSFRALYRWVIIVVIAAKTLMITNPTNPTKQ